MVGLPARSPRVSQEIHEVKMHDEKTHVNQEEQELYRFGYKLLLLQAVNIAVVIAIGLAFSCLKEMVLFLIAYVPLRSYAGGISCRRTDPMWYHICRNGVGSGSSPADSGGGKE